MAKFKLGEVVIKIDLVNFPEENGNEATVVDILSEDELIWHAGTGERMENNVTHYELDDGFCYAEHNLKKKPFKGEEDIMKLFTSLDNSGKIKTDKLIEEEIV